MELELAPLVQSLNVVLWINSTLTFSGYGCDNLWKVNESGGGVLRFIYQSDNGIYITQSPVKLYTNASGSGSCPGCTYAAQENGIEWTVSGQVSADKTTINLSAQVTAAPPGTLTITCQQNPPDTMPWGAYTPSKAPVYTTTMDFKDGASKVIVDVGYYTLTFSLIDVGGT